MTYSNSSTPQNTPRVAVIGGGPAGLMAAEVIAQAGYGVDVYDAMPSVGRKFLLAGVGGMNITHAEPFTHFLTRYADAMPALQPFLTQFGADELRAWVHGLGIETFVGSSQRVFPTDMKAAPLLRAWLHRLRGLGVKLHPRHRFMGWNPQGDLLIEVQQGDAVEIKQLAPTATLLALGGASWQRLGSNGAWVPLLRDKHIDIAPLQPSNCGFEIAWSERMRSEFAGAQLNAIGLAAVDPQGTVHSLRGEAIVSQYGIEGTSVYALSRVLRGNILAKGSAQLVLDLLPDSSLDKISAALAKPRGKNSLSNFLRKQLNVSPVKVALLWECLTKTQMENQEQLAQAIKYLPLTLNATRPIDEAISTAGGVRFNELNKDLMLKKMPSVFCAGEMLDWEAPTGGYLLTACFSTGYAAGQGIVNWLSAHQVSSQNSNTTSTKKSAGNL